MFKKSFLAVAVALFLSFLIIPMAFASSPQCVYSGKLNTSCAKKMSMAQLENLKRELIRMEKANSTMQNVNNLVKVREIIASKVK